jgi:hypothetical protein
MDGAMVAVTATTTRRVDVIDHLDPKVVIVRPAGDVGHEQPIEVLYRHVGGIAGRQITALYRQRSGLGARDRATRCLRKFAGLFPPGEDCPGSGHSPRWQARSCTCRTALSRPRFCRAPPHWCSSAPHRQRAVPGRQSEPVRNVRSAQDKFRRGGTALSGGARHLTPTVRRW